MSIRFECTIYSSQLTSFLQTFQVIEIQMEIAYFQRAEDKNVSIVEQNVINFHRIVHFKFMKAMLCIYKELMST